MRLITQKELAELLDMTPRHVRRKLERLEPDIRGTRGIAHQYKLMRVIEHWFDLNGESAGPDRSDEARQVHYNLERERARLASEQADGHAMKNAVARGELAPIDYWEDGLARHVRILRSCLDALVPALVQGLPHLSAEDHSDIERIIAEQSAAASHALAEAADPLPPPGDEPAHDEAA